MDNLEFQVLLSHFGETATLGGGTIVFIREDIPCTLPLLKPESIIELNICKKKWLISCSYNTQRNVLQIIWQFRFMYVNMYYDNYVQMILIGDFNSETEDVCIQSFCEAYELKLLSSNIFAGFSCRFQTSVCSFTKSKTRPWVFFTFLKLYKWYQIVQSITYFGMLLSCSTPYFLGV